MCGYGDEHVVYLLLDFESHFQGVVETRCLILKWCYAMNWNVCSMGTAWYEQGVFVESCMFIYQYVITSNNGKVKDLRCVSASKCSVVCKSSPSHLFGLVWHAGWMNIRHHTHTRTHTHTHTHTLSLSHSLSLHMHTQKNNLWSKILS